MYDVNLRFQATLDSLWVEAGFPGATAAFMLPDGTLRSFATGYADLEDSTRMTPDARMLSGSTGKSFAAAVALSLVREGQLDLDVRISTWLGEKPWFDRLPNAGGVTLRMLLRHQSGLVDHIHSERFAASLAAQMQTQEPNADFYLTPEQLVGFVLDTEPLFPPGAGFHYSDTNYILVGLIVEAVTGNSYYDELRRRFLAPLGLRRTGPADHCDLPGLVAGYVESEVPFGLPPKVTEGGRARLQPGHRVDRRRPRHQCAGPGALRILPGLPDRSGSPGQRAGTLRPDGLRRYVLLGEAF